MKTKNTLFKALGIAIMMLTLSTGLPETAKAENQTLNATNYKIRIDTPDADSINTTLCTIVSVYMQKDFCMFNLLIANEAGGAESSKDFYLTDPATGRKYTTKKVGGSHLTRNEIWQDGRRQLAVTFKGLPKGIKRVDLHLPGIATHILGIHLDKNGNNVAYRSPFETVKDERKGNKHFIWITAKEVADAKKMHTALSNIENVSTTITPMPQSKPEAEKRVGEKTETKTTVQPFITADWALYDLRGKVKSVIIDGVTYDFNANGKIQSINGRTINSVFKIKRDNKGRIVLMENLEEDYDGEHSGETFKWNTNNLVGSTNWYNPEGDVATTYSYNQAGYLTKKTRTGFAGDTVNETYSITYTQYDEFGNWTKRIVNCKDNAYGGTNSTEETRVITYY